MQKFLILAASLCLAPSFVSGQTLQITTQNSWQAFEILTQGDDISTISDAGYGTTATRGVYDGLGIYQSSANSLSIWINHETTPAAISRLDVDRSKLMQAITSTVNGGATSFPTGIKTGMGYAYDAIFDSSYHATTNSSPVASGTSGVASYADSNFARFCSGTSYKTNSFGVGRGFVDNMYVTGEETSGGKFYALDESTRNMWEVDALGTGRWENAALVDTGNNTHVAMILSSDVGSGSGDYLQMYVGAKDVDSNGDGSVDFLERNGLRGGTVYYFDPDGAASTTDLPDGEVMGKWSASTTGALQETKLEDLHTNPLDGSQVVWADQTDGLYVLEQNLMFDENGFDTAASVVKMSQIVDDDAPSVIGAPDNVNWSADGLIYVQEDAGVGSGIFQLNADGTDILQIATANSEPSGIVDISDYVGYQAGSVFLSSVQGNGSSGAQLVVMVSPTASAVPEPGSAIALAGLGFGLLIRRKRWPV